MSYIVQIDDKIRPATEAEAATIEFQQAEAAAQEQFAANAVVAKQSARAKLSALGLTDQEINALIP